MLEVRNLLMVEVVGTIWSELYNQYFVDSLQRLYACIIITCPLVCSALKTDAVDRLDET